MNCLAQKIALSPDDFRRLIFISTRQRSPFRRTVAAEQLRSREKILVHIKKNINSGFLTFIKNTADKIKILFVVFTRLGLNCVPRYSEANKVHSVSLHVGGKSLCPLLAVDASLTLNISALIAHIESGQNSFTSVRINYSCAFYRKFIHFCLLCFCAVPLLLRHTPCASP